MPSHIKEVYKSGGIGIGRGQGRHLYPDLPQRNILTRGMDSKFADLMRNTRNSGLTEQQQLLCMLAAIALVAPMALAAIPDSDTHSVSTFHPDNHHNPGSFHISADKPGSTFSNHNLSLNHANYRHNRHQSLSVSSQPNESSIGPAKFLDVFGSVGLQALRKILAERTTDVAQQAGDLCATNPEALCFIDTSPEGYSFLVVQIPETEGARAEINVMGITRFLEGRGLIPDNYRGNLEYDMFGPSAGCTYTGGRCTKSASFDFPDKRSFSLETDALGNQWVLFNNGDLRIPLADFVQAVNENVFYLQNNAPTLPQTPPETPPQTPPETPIPPVDQNSVTPEATAQYVASPTQTLSSTNSVPPTEEKKFQIPTKEEMFELGFWVAIGGSIFVALVLYGGIPIFLPPLPGKKEEKSEQPSKTTGSQQPYNVGARQQKTSGSEKFERVKDQAREVRREAEARAGRDWSRNEAVKDMKKGRDFDPNLRDAIERNKEAKEAGEKAELNFLDAIIGMFSGGKKG